MRRYKWKHDYKNGGNSNGIRIPNSILKSLRLKTNDIVNISQEEDKIIITIPKVNRISLEKRFKNYHGDNLAKEFEWDKSLGGEIW